MLRPVSGDAYDAIHAIWMEPSANRFLSFEPMAADDFRPVFEAMRREAALYVWVVGGEVVGTCSASRWARRASHVVTIGGVATRRDRRREGHGAAMMRALVARLAAAGAERVDVWVEADNPGAIGFYAGLGFVAEGLLRRCFRRAGEPDAVDEVVMAVYP